MTSQHFQAGVECVFSRAHSPIQQANERYTYCYRYKYRANEMDATSLTVSPKNEAVQTRSHHGSSCFERSVEGLMAISGQSATQTTNKFRRFQHYSRTLS